MMGDIKQREYRLRIWWIILMDLKNHNLDLQHPHRVIHKNYYQKKIERDPINRIKVWQEREIKANILKNKKTKQRWLKLSILKMKINYYFSKINKIKLLINKVTTNLNWHLKVVKIYSIDFTMKLIRSKNTNLRLKNLNF
jgi:hypothetical protein